jgi:hypothetical protein
MPQPATATWWAKAAPYFLGACLWLMLSHFYSCVFPDHPAPAAIEADGKSYVACNTPDTGRGWFHSTYYADFKDNNGQTISLRGVEKLTITNLPQQIDAPMPPNPVAVDGKKYREGAKYAWADGTEARVENGKWAPVKIKNNVCESDDDRRKRETRESEAREAERKREAAELEAEQKKEAAELETQQAALRAKNPCPAILTSATGEILEEPLPEAIGRPECVGHLPTRVATPEEQTKYASRRKRPDVPRAEKAATVRRWATVVTAYGTEIYKRCYFNAGDLPCGYDDAKWGKIASLHKGDRVQVVSAKSRSASGSEIYEVRFQQWTGWMDATSLSFDSE